MYNWPFPKQTYRPIYGLTQLFIRDYQYPENHAKLLFLFISSSMVYHGSS